LRQGEYELDRKMSLVRIIAVLRGRVPGLKLVRVTIPEGYSVAKIAKLLESKELISAPKFLEYVRNAKPELEAKFPFLSQVPTSNLEGYLFPETYLFAHGVSSAVVTEAFLGQFQRRVLPIWNSISASANISLHEAVTLASMIEKEAHDPAEMRLISAVFHNRLKKRINLASDPTVLYALGEPEKEIVTYADLRVDSPFNTYRRPGLPPTPIASPGAHAFAAALHPENSDFLYFVANGDGTHSFSRTLQEHVTKTRRIQRQLAKK
jgi:UPF0755 protein